MLKIIDKIVEISPTHSKRRLIVSRDELQWIMMIGHPEYSDVDMRKASNKYYYPRLDYLLKDLLIKKHRVSIEGDNELFLDTVLSTIQESLEEVKALGLEIEHNLKGLLLYESS